MANTNAANQTWAVQWYGKDNPEGRWSTDSKFYRVVVKPTYCDEEIVQVEDCGGDYKKAQRIVDGHNDAAAMWMWGD